MVEWNRGEIEGQIAEQDALGPHEGECLDKKGGTVSEIILECTSERLTWQP